MAIHPVILCGGAGSRLWPLSRAGCPKPFLPLLSGRSLLQETALRVADPARFAPVLAVASEANRFLAAEQLHALGGRRPRLLLEPAPRNTAAAAAAAALLLAAEEPQALLLLLPADHHIGDPEAFLAAVERAAPAAAAGALALFGMPALRPEGAYGYIRQGEPLPGLAGCFRIRRFVEKPDAAEAAAMIAIGGHHWNSGMFLLRADRFLAELDRFAPAVLEAARAGLSARAADLDFLRLGPGFAAAPSLSIDHAVMERTERGAVVPAAFGWADIGSWDALWTLAGKDAAGNALVGDVLGADLGNCYIRSEGRLVVALGLRDLVLVETADAVLALDRTRAQALRAAVEALVAQARPEAADHRRVLRPWGSYETIAAGERHQVKRLVVAPGGKLSLQKHAHRAEHWVVVRGRARVTRDGAVFELGENESTFIPRGAVHRLENPGPEPLQIIEVQSGDYLGEDDILRLEDRYGRR